MTIPIKMCNSIYIVQQLANRRVGEKRGCKLTVSGDRQKYVLRPSDHHISVILCARGATGYFGFVRPSRSDEDHFNHPGVEGLG